LWELEHGVAWSQVQHTDHYYSWRSAIYLQPRRQDTRLSRDAESCV
jgi:hypothetical protein